MNIPIGMDSYDEPVRLNATDLSAHVHGIGASRRGKSKLIEHIARHLIKCGHGFCLIDPHGHLYTELIEYLAYIKPRRPPVILFNPSYTPRVVGFNPFRLAGEKTDARIAAKTDRMVSATLTVWNETETSAPRLEKWLRCLYYVFVEQDLTIDVARHFLAFSHHDERTAIISRIRSGTIRDQWETLTQAKTESGYTAYLESTANRLFKFLTNPTIRRIAAVPDNAIDLEKILNTNTVLLVNLQPSDVLSAEAARIIGTLLVNDIWEIVRCRTKHQARGVPEVFLILDEFQNFATPDISAMLDEGAKFGLRLMLFHQRLSQLSGELAGSMKNAHTRFVFGGLSRLDASHMLEGAAISTEHIEATVQNPKQHFTLYRAGRSPAFVAAPTVASYPMRFDRIEAYIREKTAAYMTAECVDAVLDRMDTTPPASSTTPATPAPPTQKPSDQKEYCDEDFFE